MQTFLFVVLSWIGVSLIVATVLCSLINFSKRKQSEQFLAIRRNAWLQGLGVRS